MQIVGTASRDIKELPKDKLKRCRKRALTSTAISIRASDVHLELMETVVLLTAVNPSIVAWSSLARFDHVVIHKPIVPNVLQRRLPTESFD